MRAWFSSSFPEPTPAQARAGRHRGGEHTLILAPTGSGKTLAAFLWGIDRLVTVAAAGATQRAPGCSTCRRCGRSRSTSRRTCEPAGRHPAGGRAARRAVHRADRRACAPATRRAASARALVRHPPDILITTPESLYLMLTSAARETLARRRGGHRRRDPRPRRHQARRHLALTLERLEELHRRGRSQRIGLSATQRPLEEIARFLGGTTAPAGPGPVTIVDAGRAQAARHRGGRPGRGHGRRSGGDRGADERPGRRRARPTQHLAGDAPPPAGAGPGAPLDAHLLQRPPARPSGWRPGSTSSPIEPRARPRRAARSWCKAHHGSLSRERRLRIEDELKSGDAAGPGRHDQPRARHRHGRRRPRHPGGVAGRGVERACSASGGRATRWASRAAARSSRSTGAICSRRRSSCERMRRGLIEETRYPRNPLDVLAQQIVANCALDECTVDDARGAGAPRRAVRRALRRGAGVGARPAVRPLSVGGVRRAASAHRVGSRRRHACGHATGAQRLAVTNGGTIPDRGLFGVFLPDGTRVGELDEEMVYESRPGETFLLGASTWRIEDITFERVVVTPAPGQPGKMPFWHGDGPGRPLELGRALGAFVREIRDASPAAAVERLTGETGARRAGPPRTCCATSRAGRGGGRGARRPHDRRRAVPRRDRRLARVRALAVRRAGARAVGDGRRARGSTSDSDWPVEVMWSDDGIVLRLPEAVDELPIDELLDRPRGDRRRRGQHAARHVDVRVAVPRVRGPGAAVAPPPARPAHPAVAAAPALGRPARGGVEAPLVPDPARDHPGVPAGRVRRARARTGADRPAGRKVRMVSRRHAGASPFAQSLLFGWIAVYMYEGDAPLAERRAAALALDRDLLRDLLGAEELRELIDPGVLADLELDLQRLSPRRQARGLDEVHDLLRLLGDLSFDELDRVDARRASRGGVGRASWSPSPAGDRSSDRRQERCAGAKDAGRLRDGLGVAIPLGLPVACTEPAPSTALEHSSPGTPAPTDRSSPARLPARFGFRSNGCGRRCLGRLEAEGRVVHGEFRPDGVERESCDVEVLRQLRRRSLASLRREVEPVEADAFARFALGWQGIQTGQRHGVDGLVEVLGQLQGAPIIGQRARARRPARSVARLLAGSPRCALHVRRRRLGGVGGDRHRRWAGAAVLPRSGPAALAGRRRPGPTVRPDPREPPSASRGARRFVLVRAARSRYELN